MSLSVNPFSIAASNREVLIFPYPNFFLFSISLSTSDETYPLSTLLICNALLKLRLFVSVLTSPFMCSIENLSPGRRYLRYCFEFSRLIIWNRSATFKLFSMKRFSSVSPDLIIKSIFLLFGIASESGVKIGGVNSSSNLTSFSVINSLSSCWIISIGSICVIVLRVSFSFDGHQK